MFSTLYLDVSPKGRDGWEPQLLGEGGGGVNLKLFLAENLLKSSSLLGFLALFLLFWRFWHINVLSNHRLLEGGLFMTHFGSDRKTALADIPMEIFFYYYDISNAGAKWQHW